MTRGEWAQVAQGMVAKWPHSPVPDVSLAQFYADLADLPGVQVAAAVEVLYREGREFPPNGGQIRGKLSELTLDAPLWADARRVLQRLAVLPDRVMRVGRFVDVRAAALERSHPAVRAFVATVGWQELGAAAADDRVAEAQLRTKYERHVTRRERDMTLLGIPAAGLPGLERIASSGPRRIGEAVVTLTAGVTDQGGSP